MDRITVEARLSEIYCTTLTSLELMYLWLRSFLGFCEEVLIYPAQGAASTGATCSVLSVPHRAQVHLEASTSSLQQWQVSIFEGFDGCPHMKTSDLVRLYDGYQNTPKFLNG